MVDSIQPTEAEMQILSVLWKSGPATVREVHTVLIKSRKIGYTTVLKLMQIMTEKGLLLRDESKRSHVYRARQKPETMQRRIVRDVIAKVFSGSTKQLVLRALTAKRATPEQIAEIRKMLDEIEKENEK